MKAEVITIGDEILIGQTIDTNSAWMAKELNLIGIEIIQISSVMDRISSIQEAIRLAETRAEIILVTGGLGPTRDDITKHAIAEYFGSRLRLNEEALKNIKTLFSRRGLPLLDINRDQAFIPENCKYIPNLKGTAPGMWFEENDKIFISMPGVPYEMKSMMQHFVLPTLSALDHMDKIVHRTITVVNIPESILSKMIEDIELSLPEDLSLAYLPHLNLVRIRISGRSKSREAKDLEKEIDDSLIKIKKKIGGDWFEGDRSLSEIVGELLSENRLSIGTVESCSGGFIAHTLTKVPGASSYFQGSLLTYSNELKMEKLGVLKETLMTVGAVSEEVAFQMAKAGHEQLHVDYCISTTGIAGPTGATDIKPVGLVYIGLALPDGQILVKKHNFHGNREQIIERIANSALNWVREILSDRIRSQSGQKPAQH